MANKHINMLKTFFKVITNDKYYQSLVIPNMYKKTIFEIDYKKLKKLKMTNLIFDIDNTILPVDSCDVEKKLINFFKKLTKDEFNICIVSNNNLDRVKEPAEILKVKYIANAKKPNKEAFEKAMQILNSNNLNTVMIGDQMLSDIKGAKENGLYAILVDPLENKYNIQTKTSRVLQDIIEKKLKKQNKFIKGMYY